MTLSLNAGEVLDLQAQLAARLLRPTPAQHDFMRFVMQDAWGKDPDRARGMFYPIVTLKDRVISPEQAMVMSRVLGLGVQNATCYQVSSEMVGIMRAVYLRTKAKIEKLDQAELPEAVGFAWLDDPWPIVDLHQETTWVRALGWQFETVQSREGPLPCARVTLWAHFDDDLEKGTMTPEEVTRDIRDLGHLTVIHSVILPFNERFRMPEELDNQGTESFLGLVHLLWMFLGMEIVSSQPAKVARPFRRRALRSLKHGEVHVVMLRRLAHPDTGEDITHTEVDWSCQWVVQGHWRHLAPGPDVRPHRAVVGGPADADGYQHCIQCDGQVTWVRPYIKGPDGKPLKVSRTLMKLAR